MTTCARFAHPDDIRASFSRAMSAMYRAEVPQYGALLELVSQVNREVLDRTGSIDDAHREFERVQVERHGAIRVGTTEELRTLRRLFALMGMSPVSYYDLSVAGIPVHATAFRPLDEASLQRNPFRVFTSLLRPDLIADQALREKAMAILAHRKIFTTRCLALIEQGERDGGLGAADASAFVDEALETFRWHSEATVDHATYQRLRDSHALTADIVCFRAPHINHLTPRTLDIDAAQQRMDAAGIDAKETIEGPPRRRVPILLRQTSFLALSEAVRFPATSPAGAVEGTHTARFGEIEQRGCALTRKGRELYDRLLADASARASRGQPMAAALEEAFARFPDDLAVLHSEGLAFCRYRANLVHAAQRRPSRDASTSTLLEGGWLQLHPLTYEDFLPVSAAGIFRSNLGTQTRDAYAQSGRQQVFEQALGVPVADEFALYSAAQQASLAISLRALQEACAHG